jgi:hypothetical protein
MFERIKQLFCRHSYNYWGIEYLYASEGDEHRGVATPVYTFTCRKCGHKIIIWDRRKQ